MTFTRRFAHKAGATGIAALMLSGALAGTGAYAAVTLRHYTGLHAAHSRHVAYDTVTKTMVAIPKSPGSTPVHPEKVTHPQLDVIGAELQSASAAAASGPPGLHGIDVNSHNGNINWNRVAGHVSFVYAKATEGTYYHNPDFTNQYEGPYDHHVLRGAYHFAIPNNSSGSTQANFFVHHGGGWSRDGRTLPGTLDIEYNPYGRACYGLSRSRMRSWIWSFVDTYAHDTGVYPVIYTSTSWWRMCTGNANGFQKYDPLWIACYCRYSGSLPSGYRWYTFWQYADHSSLPGDPDVFNGSYARLKALSLG